MTNVPQPSFGDTGYSTPQEVDILAGVLADFNSAFGGNLNPDLTTPQGQFAQVLTALLGYQNDQFLSYVAGVDPATSSGRMQDGIGRIYFINRLPALATTAVVTVGGLPGTVIPEGAQSRATDGTYYACTGDITIGNNGQGSGTFAALATGPTPCPAGTLSTVITQIARWDTITNPADGIVGRDLERRADFEARRRLSVSQNAVGTLDALRGAILNTAGVSDAFVIDNPAATAVTIGGVLIAAHSIYVAASGGKDSAVARAIWSKKPPGCGYAAGTTTVTVTDNATPGYATPPTYGVTFTRPTAIRIRVGVTIANSAGVPSDAQAQIAAAVISAFNGQDGGSRAGIGSTIYALRFVGDVQMLGDWANVVSVVIGSGSGAPSAASVTANINQTPTLTANDVLVTLA
jgi:hypothetical protein